MSARQKTVDEPATGEAPRRRWLKDAARVVGTGLISDGLGAATSLLLRLAIEPAPMGVWQVLKLLLAYGNFSNLGISKGAAREQSRAQGSGDRAAAERSTAAAYTISTFTSAVYAMGLVVAAGWMALRGRGAWSSVWAWGLLAVAVMCWWQRHVTFQISMLRSRGEFRLTSRLTLVESLGTLTLVTAGAWCWGFSGMLAGTLAVFVLAASYLRWVAGVRRPAWRWDRQESLRLISIGAPILATGVLSSAYRTLDRWMILSFSVQAEFLLGAYSLALLVSTQLFGVGNLLAIVLAPRCGEVFGRTRNPQCVAELVARAAMLMAAVLAAVGIAALLMAPPLLGWLLPKYSAGLGPLLWLLPGTWALAMTLPLQQYLQAVDGQRRALGVQAAMLALAVGVDVCVLHQGGGLREIALATSWMHVAYLILLSQVSIVPRLTVALRWRYAAALLASGGSIWCIAALRNGERPGLPLGLASMALVLVLIGSLAGAWARRGALGNLARGRA